jgi:hypothetical protein
MVVESSNVESQRIESEFEIIPPLIGQLLTSQQGEAVSTIFIASLLKEELASEEKAAKSKIGLVVNLPVQGPRDLIESLLLDSDLQKGIFIVELSGEDRKKEEVKLRGKKMSCKESGGLIDLTINSTANCPYNLPLMPGRIDLMYQAWKFEYVPGDNLKLPPGKYKGELPLTAKEQGTNWSHLVTIFIEINQPPKEIETFDPEEQEPLFFKLRTSQQGEAVSTLVSFGNDLLSKKKIGLVVNSPAEGPRDLESSVPSDEPDSKYILRVELQNAQDGKKSWVTLRGEKTSGCLEVNTFTINSTDNCDLAVVPGRERTPNTWKFEYVPEDNLTLKPGKYTGVFPLTAKEQGTSWSASITINIEIDKPPTEEDSKPEEKEETLKSDADVSGSVRVKVAARGTLVATGFVTHNSEEGPTELNTNGSSLQGQSSQLTALVRDENGKEQRINLRGQKVYGCGFPINVIAGCPQPFTTPDSSSSYLEVKYIPEENTALPAGKYTGILKLTAKNKIYSNVESSNKESDFKTIANITINIDITKPEGRRARVSLPLVEHYYINNDPEYSGVIHVQWLVEGAEQKSYVIQIHQGDKNGSVVKTNSDSIPEKRDSRFRVNLAPGEYTLEITVTDTSGNTSVAYQSFQVSEKVVEGGGKPEEGSAIEADLISRGEKSSATVSIPGAPPDNVGLVINSAKNSNTQGPTQLVEYARGDYSDRGYVLYFGSPENAGYPESPNYSGYSQQVGTVGYAPISLELQDQSGVKYRVKLRGSKAGCYGPVFLNMVRYCQNEERYGKFTIEYFPEDNSTLPARTRFTGKLELIAKKPGNIESPKTESNNPEGTWSRPVTINIEIGY